MADISKITLPNNNQYDIKDNIARGQIENLQSELENKVDKITGKSLSTNDYTTEEKNKLTNIEPEANKIIIDSALSSTSENPLQNKIINTAFERKTDYIYLGAFTASSIPEGMKLAWDALTIYDRPVQCNFNTFGMVLCSAYKYAGGKYGQMYGLHYDTAGIYLLNVNNGTKTITYLSNYANAIEEINASLLNHTNAIEEINTDLTYVGNAQTILIGEKSSVFYQKVGKMVLCYCTYHISDGTISSWSSKTLTTLPEGYRPIGQGPIVPCVTDRTSSAGCIGQVTSSGAVIIAAKYASLTDTNDIISFYVSYPIV